MNPSYMELGGNVVGQAVTKRRPAARASPKKAASAKERLEDDAEVVPRTPRAPEAGATPEAAAARAVEDQGEIRVIEIPLFWIINAKKVLL